jgi:type IV secretory pathway protease TraF
MNRHHITGALGCLSVLYVLYGIVGLRWNFSPSMPVGLWRVTHEQVHRGSVVALDEVMKEVAGLPGDSVTFTRVGVYINGQLWPDSTPIGANHYPFGSMVLQPGEYLLMGRNKLSWDARYNGWTTATIIASTARPLWVKSR